MHKADEKISALDTFDQGIDHGSSSSIISVPWTRSLSSIVPLVSNSRTTARSVDDDLDDGDPTDMSSRRAHRSRGVTAHMFYIPRPPANTLRAERQLPSGIIICQTGGQRVLSRVSECEAHRECEVTFTHGLIARVLQVPSLLLPCSH